MMLEDGGRWDGRRSEVEGMLGIELIAASRWRGKLEGQGRNDSHSHPYLPCVSSAKDAGRISLTQDPFHHSNTCFLSRAFSAPKVTHLPRRRQGRTSSLFWSCAHFLLHSRPETLRSWNHVTSSPTRPVETNTQPFAQEAAPLLSTSELQSSLTPTDTLLLHAKEAPWRISGSTSNTISRRGPNLPAYLASRQTRKTPVSIVSLVD